MNTFKTLFSLLIIAVLLTSCGKDPEYFITNITVTSFPEMQGSIPWDDNGGEEPDLFPRISAGGVEFWELQNYQTSHLEDATLAMLPWSWLIPSQKIEGETQYTFELWDYDYVTSNELMSSARFTPEDHTYSNGTTDIVVSSSQMSVTITVEKEE